MKPKLAYLGIYAAIAIILGYVESLVPVFPGIPGIKLGLANLAVLYILKKYSFREAALVSLVRILVIGFLFGSLSGILYSLAGAAFSLLVMTLLLSHTSLSLVTVSVCGGVAHNVAQMVIAWLLLRSTAFFYYLPALLVSGVVTGILIGLLTQEISKRLP
ncbi:MAG: Gx transporter family protein [Blautia sp.]|nr:Gx transporter family protein [Blautia sp.]